MNGNKKKEIAIGIAFLFFSAGVIAAKPITDTETIENQINIHIAKEDVGHEEKVHYTFALNFHIIFSLDLNSTGLDKN